MIININLPFWLDKYIFGELKANYCRSNSDMTVIDWDKSKILDYLGTYFPRSFAESYNIFRTYFENNSSSFLQKETISIFDFCCGTGGEIIGLLTALVELFPNIKKVYIKALDGKVEMLRLYEKLINKFQKINNIEIINKPTLIKIDDFYDLGIINDILDKKFNIIMSFKAICEFVTKECFEKNNPYEHIAKTFLPKLDTDGIIVLVDVSSKNDVSKKWLPKMLDDGLNQVPCKIVGSNQGHNHTFYVSHSHKSKDISKVVWRIIMKK